MAAVVLSRSTPTPPPPIVIAMHSAQPAASASAAAAAVAAAATPKSPPTLATSASEAERVVPIAIPNKHMPCPNPGGLLQFASPVTPPASPPNDTLPLRAADAQAAAATAAAQAAKEDTMESLLHPPDDYVCLSPSPPVYAIDAAGLAAAVGFTARQPLPDIEQLFPWAHGLHPDNALQLAFFAGRKRPVLRRPPTCYRGICIVQVGRDPAASRLKGAVVPQEILPADPSVPGFLCADPPEGFGVRNFHIQVAKFATLSDVVVYADDDSDPGLAMAVARRISAAQLHHRRAYAQAHAQAQAQTQAPVVSSSRAFPKYHTFVVESAFSVFETLFPELVAVDSKGNLTGKVVEFCHWERMEMCSMSRASEISTNVWLGSTADIRPGPDHDHDHNGQDHGWGVLIEACDQARMPPPKTLRRLLGEADHSSAPLVLEFPGSGTISSTRWTNLDADATVDTCRWIHAIATGQRPDSDAHHHRHHHHHHLRDADGDHCMLPPPVKQREPRKILIHCTDGYTETSLLALAYLMYSDGLAVHDAWIKLHTDRKRNFFAYDKDLSFLRYLESTLLGAATRDGVRGAEKAAAAAATRMPPEWLYRMDGSLPSRVLSYMYLGNLLHANNCGLLRALGIKRVLSIGEHVAWSEDEKTSFGRDKLMTVRDLQDNGCDSLESQFRHCLEFLDDGHRLDEPILVHCRVGVSRSATVCIAEVMRSLKLSLPRAYCYVRARRLNVIIQPHLRFMYELLKFEESLAPRNGSTPKRELEWIHVAREITAMNRPYTRQS